MSQSPPARIAIVDEDEAVRHAMGFLLESLGQANDLFGSAEDFLRANPGEYRGLITDLNLRHKNGLELASQLRAAAITLPTLLMTPELTAETVEAGRAMGIDHFCTKPVSVDQLADFLTFAR